MTDTGLSDVAADEQHTPFEEFAARVKPRQASTVLLCAIVVFFLIFVVWASWATLDRTVRGAGRVIASSQLQVVSNLEGGVVEEILVRTGQVVRAGEPLVRLDPTATGSDLSSGEAQTAALLVKIARLKAEVLGRKPAYPPASNAVLAEQIEIERACTRHGCRNLPESPGHMRHATCRPAAR